MKKIIASMTVGKDVRYRSGLSAPLCVHAIGTVTASICRIGTL